MPQQTKSTPAPVKKRGPPPLEPDVPGSPTPIVTPQKSTTPQNRPTPVRQPKGIHSDPVLDHNLLVVNVPKKSQSPSNFGFEEATLPSEIESQCPVCSEYIKHKRSDRQVTCPSCSTVSEPVSFGMSHPLHQFIQF